MPPSLTVMIGAPGAGKTTLARSFDGAVFSLDASRARLGLHPGDQAATPAAVADVVSRADYTLSRRIPTVIDATGATPRDRSTWLALARRHNTTPVALRVITPLFVCLDRNSDRLDATHVPADVLIGMWQGIDTTSDHALYQEGFEVVEHVRGH